jgi:hypothetical protein
MKIIALAAVSTALALAACSNAEDKAAPAAAEAPADPNAHMARAAFEGLPQSCLELADKMDRYRTCATTKFGAGADPAEMAAGIEQSQAQAVSMAADLRKLPAADAAEACSANHEMMDNMGQDIVGPDC